MSRMLSNYRILFFANVLIFLSSCSSTRYIVSHLDTSYQGQPAAKQIGNVIVSIPKDSRNNKLNVPNFDRTWGYLTDRGMYNNVLSTENVISADIADIIVGAFRAKGYNAKVAEPGGLPKEGIKIIESEIRQFWVDSKCYGFGFFNATTLLSLHLKVLDSSSREVLQNINVTVKDKQTKGAVTMEQGVKKTVEVFSQNLEKFKSILLEKIATEPEK